jgi:translation initiation factor 3 subunit E
MGDPVTTADGGAPSVADYDLLPKLVQYFDRHMIFPLLEFSAHQVAPDEETGEQSAEDTAKWRQFTRTKYELLKKTNMTDYVANLYCELEGLDEAPAEFAEQRQKVINQLEKFENETGKIKDLITRDDVVNNLRSDKEANMEFLKKEHEVRQPRVDPALVDEVKSKGQAY